MNVTVIGAGYVGLVTAACLSDLGANVVCMDISKEKIDNLNNGIIPIYEPGLENIVKKSCISKKLHFTSDIQFAVNESDIIFLAVGTPSKDDGSVDLQYLFTAIREIAKFMDRYKLIVIKSTVPIGTAKKATVELISNLNNHRENIPFDIVSNPEFLREGTAVKDFLNPDRIVIGTESNKAIEIMKNLYEIQISIDTPFIVTNSETAEMIKYASNAFLATKISFINEVANICELGGADVKIVSLAMGLDDRIGSKFLNPGPGYGGSCFPKDTKAFVDMGKILGYIPSIVKTVIRVNKTQVLRMFKKIKRATGELEDKTITILGLSFKPETDDIRESPSISIIKLLLKHNARVNVYDPKAMENTKAILPELKINYYDDLYSACEKSHCVVISTDWNEFKNIDFLRLKSIMSIPALIDLRNIYEPNYIRGFEFLYLGVGRI